MIDAQRLAFLIETAELEVQHLLDTDRRLFSQSFNADRATALRKNIDESERTDAFVARFGRLQDTVADKLPFTRPQSSSAASSAIGSTSTPWANG